MITAKDLLQAIKRISEQKTPHEQTEWYCPKCHRVFKKEDYNFSHMGCNKCVDKFLKEQEWKEKFTIRR